MNNNESSGKVLLITDNICKVYAAPVLNNINFELHSGEVHALVGENGAGKSTLAKIICGIVKPNYGSMKLFDKNYLPLSREEAENKGVNIVMQELNLINTLSIAENLFINKLPNKLGFISYPDMNKHAKKLMDTVGLHNINPALPVGSLGIGQQQMVEIAASVTGNCNVIILDEPTSMLTDREIKLLYEQIRRLKSNGAGIIYISHRLEEIRQIADRITVLRDGNLVDTRPVKDVSIDEIVKMMVGREVTSQFNKGNRKFGKALLEVKNLNRANTVKDVSFKVREGEILGFAGLVGSGRTETMRLIFGADKLDSGTVYINGSNIPIKIRSPKHAIANGIAMITEDRKEQGLLLSNSVKVNTTLAKIKGVSNYGWIDRKKEYEVTKKYADIMSLKTSSYEQSVNSLSGRNQQKVVIARWLYADCKIMLFDEPTRGIDVGAKYYIYEQLKKLAEEGKAIIIVSSDLRELLMICDRIIVMSAGKIVKIFNHDEFDKDAILSAAFSEYIENGKETLN